VGVDYVEETEGWEPWQLDYRYGALYVFPPAGVIEKVDRLRERHDPVSHAICQAHVSITEPVPRAMTDDDLDQMRSALSSIEPFEVSYSRPYAPTPHPGVVYRIEPQATFQRLRAALHSLPLFDGLAPRRQGVPAHMTIAEFLSVTESEALAQRLGGRAPQGSWSCRDVEYAVPDRGFTFRRVRVVPLGRPVRG
jgi:2'-5' RNA ligase